MAVRVSKEEFAEKVLKNTLPVIVDYYSDSCVACKRLAPVLGDLEDNYEGRLEVVKVNTNFDGDLAADYNVLANPTLIVFKNGEEKDRRTGAASYADIESFITPYI